MRRARMAALMKSGDLISGRYRLTQRLGTGAMGAVWEAVNERTGRKVALKLILHPTEDHRVRLLREARACGSLAHRNIVEIYDVGETDTGDPFLVMQLLTGDTLEELLRRRRRLEPPLTARITRDIASALAAAHDAKILHRDLKPANIILHREDGTGGEEDFVVKVLDFGVSKNLDVNDGRATATGMVVGSPAYMSPEQIRVDKDIDGRSDLWSLGIMMFEMLTGVRPFVETHAAIIGQVLAAPIPPVSSRVRHVPPEIDGIVARCLERDRSKRFQDARELGRALGAFVEGSQASRLMLNAPPPSGPGRPVMGSAPEIRPPSNPQMPAMPEVGTRVEMRASADPRMRTLGSAPDIRPSPPPSNPLATPVPSPRGSAPEMRAPADPRMPKMGPVPEIRPALGYGQGTPATSGLELLESTMPLDGNHRPAGQEGPWDAPTLIKAKPGAAAAPSSATQVLSPSAPVPSWRLEMQQALAASRQTGATPEPGGMPLGLRGAALEAVEQGGTMALPPEAIAPMMGARGQHAAATTTTAPTVKLTEAAQLPHEGAPARKRVSGALVMALLGVGAATVVVFVMLAWQLLQSGAPGGEKEQAALPGSASAGHEPPGPAQSAAPAQPTAPPPAPPPAVEEPAAPVPAGSMGEVAPPAGTPAPTVQPSAPKRVQPLPSATAVTKQPLPPCGKFITTNCYHSQPQHQPQAQPKPFNPKRP